MITSVFAEVALLARFADLEGKFLLALGEQHSAIFEEDTCDHQHEGHAHAGIFPRIPSTSRVDSATSGS